MIYNVKKIAVERLTHFNTKYSIILSSILIVVVSSKNICLVENIIEILVDFGT